MGMFLLSFPTTFLCDKEGKTACSHILSKKYSSRMINHAACLRNGDSCGIYINGTAVE